MNDNNRELLPFRRRQTEEDIPPYVVHERQNNLHSAGEALEVAKRNTGYSEPQAAQPPKEEEAQPAKTYEFTSKEVAKPVESDQLTPDQEVSEPQQTIVLSMVEQARRDALQALSEGPDSLDEKLAGLGYGPVDEREAA
jgi:hypothetical protein